MPLDRHIHGAAGDGERPSENLDGAGLSLDHGEACRLRRNFDLENGPVPDGQAESETLPAGRTHRREAEAGAVALQAAETVDKIHPGPGHRGDVQALRRVVVVVVQIEPGGVARVVHRLGHVAEAGGQDGMDRGRQR